MRMGSHRKHRGTELAALLVNRARSDVWCVFVWACVCQVEQEVAWQMWYIFKNEFHFQSQMAQLRMFVYVDDILLLFSFPHAGPCMPSGHFWTSAYCCPAEHLPNTLIHFNNCAVSLCKPDDRMHYETLTHHNEALISISHPGWVIIFRTTFKCNYPI